MGVPIRGYPNYEIEPDGRVFSKYSNKYLKQSMSGSYYSVELFNSHGSKRKTIHRMVAEAYIPNPDNLPQVNHKDENKLNNDVSNLEWCTRQYNMTYGTIIKRRVKNTDFTNPFYRENAYKNSMKQRKPVARYTKDGTYIDSFASAAEAQRKLGFASRHITEVCRGKRKSSNGYVWAYEGSVDLSECQY